MLRSFKALIVVGGLLAAGLITGSSVATSARNNMAKNPYEGLDTLARTMTTIRANHLETHSPLELVHGAIAGMLSSLDPYSRYLSPEQYDELSRSTAGQIGRLGIHLTLQDGILEIDRVSPGGPADLAGIQVGDQIQRIEGTAPNKLTLAETATMLEGARGSSVHLDLIRPGSPPITMAVVVVRDDPMSEGVVSGTLLDGGIAHIKIDAFQWRTTEELVTTLQRLEPTSSEPPNQEQGALNGIVLDLRDNPGGLLDEAVATVDLFVGDELVVETRGRNPHHSSQEHATTQPSDRTTPLVILVNEGSASASELVAGALQDLGRAIIVGGPTTGKGVFQRVYEFEDGSALYLTVAQYYLPSGRPIGPDTPVVPDHPVVQESSENDPQLDAAVALLRRPL